MKSPGPTDQRLQVAVRIFWAEFSSSRLKQQNSKKEEDDADNGEFTSKEKDLRWCTNCDWTWQMVLLDKSHVFLPVDFAFIRLWEKWWLEAEPVLNQSASIFYHSVEIPASWDGLSHGKKRRRAMLQVKGVEEGWIMCVDDIVQRPSPWYHDISKQESLFRGLGLIKQMAKCWLTTIISIIMMGFASRAAWDYTYQLRQAVCP